MAKSFITEEDLAAAGGTMGSFSPPERVVSWGESVDVVGLALYVCFTGVIDLVCLGDLRLGSGTIQIRDEGLSCPFIKKEEKKNRQQKSSSTSLTSVQYRVQCCFL